MNKITYLLPIASLPLLAFAQASASRHGLHENPWVSYALAFVVCLIIAAFFLRILRPGCRGRVAIAAAASFVNWIVAASFVASGGGGILVGTLAATVSALILGYCIVRHADLITSPLRRRAEAVRRGRQ